MHWPSVQLLPKSLSQVNNLKGWQTSGSQSWWWSWGTYDVWSAQWSVINKRPPRRLERYRNANDPPDMYFSDVEESHIILASQLRIVGIPSQIPLRPLVTWCEPDCRQGHECWFPLLLVEINSELHILYTVGITTTTTSPNGLEKQKSLRFSISFLTPMNQKYQQTPGQNKCERTGRWLTRTIFTVHAVGSILDLGH